MCERALQPVFRSQSCLLLLQRDDAFRSGSSKGDKELPRLIYKFKIVPASIFVKIGMLILRFTWKYKEPRVATTTLKGKSKAEGVTPADFETCLLVKLQRPSRMALGVRIDSME